MSDQRGRRRQAVLLGLVLAALAPAGRTGAGSAASEPAAVRAFAERVHDYVRLSRRAKAPLPRLGSKASAEKIDRRVEGHADAIRRLRAGAQPGDIFTPDVVAHIAAIVRSEVKGAAGATEREAIKDDMPRRFKPVVNADYPEAEPLSTVPPSLLARLPLLPEELDYRFVGRDLILRDVKANLIVDYIPGCLPPL